MKLNKIFLATCLTLLIIASYASIFTVNADEQVIVTQFGNVAKLPITKPGLHLRIPFIQKVHYLPNHRVFELSTSLISRQLVDYGSISLEQHIQYKIGDPIKYFSYFGNNVDNKEPIIQALRASMAAVSKGTGILKIDDFSNSRKQVIRVKHGAEFKVLKDANALLNPKGIQIIKLAISIES